MDDIINFLDDNIIRIAFKSNINLALVEAVLDHIAPFIEKATEPVSLLVNVKREGRWTLPARRRVVRMLKDNSKLDQVAICNAPSAARVVANFFITASRRSETMQIFDNEESAMSWLKR